MRLASCSLTAQLCVGLACVLTPVAAQEQSSPVPPLEEQPERQVTESDAAQTEAPPTLTPPLLMTGHVDYPPDASGAAVVVLELVVERDGTVGSATVVEGPEPFASAAAEQARSFRFEPAKRAGLAVPARIRFEVRFTPPPIAPQPDAPSVAAPAPEVLLPRAQPIQVQVLGDIAPGAVALPAAEVRMLAGAFGDPFRAISILPSAGPLVSGLPVFFARGAPPGNLGYLIDGIRVPLLFHAFFGPAVVHPRMVERVELHAGGYPASFGRFAGGVVSADLSQPRGELGVEWSVRLFDSGAYVEVPFAGGRGNLQLAGRYSYSALLLSLLSDLKLEYWDYQALATYDLGRDSRLGVFVFGAFDYAATDVQPDPRAGVVTGDFGGLGGGENAVLFHRVDLRYDQRVGAGTKLRAAVTLGSEATRGTQGLVRDLSVAGRFELRSQLGARALLRAGASAGLDDYELRLSPDTENYTDVVRLFPTRTDGVIGAHADVELTAAPGVTVTPGIRVDRYTSLDRAAVGVSPRLSASLRVNERVSIEHALGIADQPPNFVPGVPAVAVAGLPGGLQRSLQTSAGVRADLPFSINASATVFNNALFNLTDPFSQNQDLELDADEALVRSMGHTFGFELLLTRRMSERFGGILSYTLARSTRSHGRIHTLSGYDRPHILNLAASYDLGSRWLVSARSVFYSGVPGSRTLGERRIFDRSRAAPFFRLDARIEKRFVISPTAWWGVSAELMNATLSEEVLRRPCEPDCRDETVGPIVLPSVGVSGQF